MPLQAPTVLVQDEDPFLEDIDFWLNTREADDEEVYIYLTIHNGTDRPIYQFNLGARWRNPAREGMSWRYTQFGFSATYPIMPGETSLPFRQAVSPDGTRRLPICAERATFVHLRFSMYMGDGLIQAFGYNLLFPRHPLAIGTQALGVRTADDPAVLVTMDELELVYIWNEPGDARLAVTNNSEYTIRVTEVQAANQGRFEWDAFQFSYRLVPGETGFGEHRRETVPEGAEGLEILRISFLVFVGDYGAEAEIISITYCFRLGHYRVGVVSPSTMAPGSLSPGASG